MIQIQTKQKQKSLFSIENTTKCLKIFWTDSWHLMLHRVYCIYTLNHLMRNDGFLIDDTCQCHHKFDLICCFRWFILFFFKFEWNNFCKNIGAPTPSIILSTINQIKLNKKKRKRKVILRQISALFANELVRYLEMRDHVKMELWKII